MNRLRTTLLIALCLICCQSRAEDNCNTPENIAKYGKTLMLPEHDGIAYGISTSITKFKAGEPITLAVRLDNRTDSAIQTENCPGWVGDAVPYHWYGTRVTTTPKPIGCGGSCRFTFEFTVPAHSCFFSGQASNDVSYGFDGVQLDPLPSGTYDIVFIEHPATFTCPDWPSYKPSGSSLRIMVE